MRARLHPLPATRFTHRCALLRGLTSVVLACSTAMGAHAQAVPAESGLALWEIGVFAGALSTPAYPASIERNGRGLVLPVLVYRGEVFRAERGNVGARIVHTDDTEFDIGFAASLPASSDDIAARQGMPDLGTLVEFGPRLKTVLARPDTHSQIRFELPVRSVIEIQGGLRSQGLAVEPELVWTARMPGSAWGLSSSVSLVFGDDRLNHYFYGVSADLATSTRPAYAARAGLIASRVGFNVFRALGPDVRVFGFLRAESYAGSANASSPLHLRDTGTSAGVGLNWTLGRSEARAR